MRSTFVRAFNTVAMIRPAGALVAAALAVSACSGGGESLSAADPGTLSPVYGDTYRHEDATYSGGVQLYGDDDPRRATAVAVNAFLWRASLDTVAFLPLLSADPFGGVIITDWYAPPETPNERFKVNVYVLGRVLRADGVHVSVFRQTKDEAGQWADAPISEEVTREFENAILTAARQLRMSAVVDKD